MKKIFSILILLGLTGAPALAKKYEPVPSNVELPAKYTQEYIDSISPEYKDVSDEQIFHVALDMLKGTEGMFSRNAILGNNLSQRAMKIEFRDLGQINQKYGVINIIPVFFLNIYQHGIMYIRISSSFLHTAVFKLRDLQPVLMIHRKNIQRADNFQ